jgi:DNA-binding NarL/FixJ family response regulator
VRVVIAEDLFLLRDGLTRLLQAYGLQVAAAVDDGPGLLAAVTEHQPDVAIVDVRLPPTFTDEGLKAALTARALPVRRAALRPRAAGRRHRRHRLPA